MNLLFIILATLGAALVCLYLPAPDWIKISAFAIWFYLAADFVLTSFTDKSLLDHLLNRE